MKFSLQGKSSVVAGRHAEMIATIITVLSVFPLTGHVFTMVLRILPFEEGWIQAIIESDSCCQDGIRGSGRSNASSYSVFFFGPVACSGGMSLIVSLEWKDRSVCYQSGLETCISCEFPIRVLWPSRGVTGQYLILNCVQRIATISTTPFRGRLQFVIYFGPRSSRNTLETYLDKCP